MPIRSFDEDARQATATALPVPRGIAFRYESPGDGTATLIAAQEAVKETLSGWEVREVAGLPGWFEAIAPARPESATTTRPIDLGEFWVSLRTLAAVPGVTQPEPLLLMAHPQSPSAPAAEAFAARMRGEAFGLWGLLYDQKTTEQIEKNRVAPDWHLAQMNVRDAWDFWQAKHPGRLPGDGILVGHPDTGFTDHPEVLPHLRTPGKSFLRDNQGMEEPSARDDLRVVFDEFIESPGHGTATACVIASGGDRGAVDRIEAFGVAPGARILPLRVSRSVIHFEFGNVARAIAHAVDQRADVISMSLGGPGYSELVRESIRKAHEQGVIVVAAAGNFLPAVAFPAAYPEVIAVAATHAAAEPWRFSAIGRLVDIAAPGEDVWRARAELDNGKPAYSVTMGTGTSFATACVAGLAALWLSYHGGPEAIAATLGELRLVPFAFQLLLAKTANTARGFVAANKHGKGLADAAALLAAPLPSRAEVAAFEQEIRAQPVNILTFFAGLLTGGMAVSEGDAETAADAEREEQAQRKRLRQIFGRMSDELLDELLLRIAADQRLLIALHYWRPGESQLPLFERLLGPRSFAVAGPAEITSSGLSPALRERLEKLRRDATAELAKTHRGTLVPGVSLLLPQAMTAAGAPLPQPPEPIFRQLQAYSFDPSLGTAMDTAPIHRVMIPARWEPVAPGPIGEYLEVVDIDPASGCLYSPVDLNHPHVLAQDGLSPSEGNPQFHQQMVYAVAMNTIHRFELALGRPVFWSNLRPWLRDHPEEADLFTPEAIELLQPAGGAETPSRAHDQESSFDPMQTRYVQRLRVYPHALREPNAFYSPTKRALLFGYFPSEDDTGREFPGGTVFTCLSHDIIAHETTHALLDGMHPYFNEPSNEDVFAFHEAFADIMALFQHFTYPEVLRHQIANTRGNLATDNLLGQLAQQFGQATGQRGALRDYLGKKNERGEWERTRANPRALEGARESHERGSILVAAVFDAFLALYNERVGDLLRIATGGTGVLPAGRIHPDLANRLAIEAAQIAEEVLRICIRAMDYLPPVDVTFGEFLRALITADYDLAPVLGRKNRIAFIEAFRSWGIYPRDVRTLSDDSLRWRGPEAGSPLQAELQEIHGAGDYRKRIVSELVGALEGWQPGSSRQQVFRKILAAQAGLHTLLREMQRGRGRPLELLPGLDLHEGATFSVGNLRPARRLGPLGEFRTEMVVEVVQTDRQRSEETIDGLPLRGGATLIVDLNSWEIRYIIYKRLYRTLPDRARGKPGVLTHRLQRRLQPEGQPVWQGEAAANLARQLVATYSTPRRLRQRMRDEPFALLHRGF